MKRYVRNSVYIRAGVTAFAVIAASMFLYFVLFHTKSLASGYSKFMNVISPLLFGAIIAYIMNPIMQLIENLMFRLLRLLKLEPKKPAAHSAIRVISVFLAAFLFFYVIYGLVSLLLPELIDSVRSIVTNYPTYESNVVNWFNQNIESENANETMAQVMVYADRLYDWIVTKMPTLDSIASNVTSGVIRFISFVLDFVLGLIISIYLLSKKEVIAAKGKRFMYGAFPTDSANRVLHNLRFIDEKFGGFVIGKVIDSVIIGIICYICVLLLRMPYPILISVVIGVTKVIPFFGPFIGAIPCAILVFVNSPIKALYFIIFIILLQQFDGNILGPHILGNSTGLSGLMVVVAIILCNGIFGIAGAFIGVPLVATVVGFVQAALRRSIERKNLPKDLSYYGHVTSIDETTHRPVEKESTDRGQSLYDRVKKQDARIQELGVDRFIEKENAKSKDAAKKKSDLPKDPVDITEEEARSSRNTALLK